MFKCENCESGYPARVASSWDFCPRCLSDSEIVVPLTFELGWNSQAGWPDVVAAASGADTGSAESIASTALD
jgi:hypothetical protein